MKQSSHHWLSVIVFLLWAGTAPITALDGPAVIGPESQICGFVAWERLYDQAVAALQHINDPSHAGKKALIAMLAPLVEPALRAAAGVDPAKTCASNMRVLLGAVEMYNMDNKEMLTHPDIPQLTKGGYLQAAPVCPDQGTYSARGNLTESGVIVCSQHGDVEHITAAASPAVAQSAASIDQLIERFLAFHHREVCRPRGGVWFSIDDRLRPRLILQAAIKPKDLHDALTPYRFHFLEFTKVEADRVGFKLRTRMPGPGDVSGEILPDGIKIGSDFPSAPTGATWSDFLANARQPDTLYTIELDGERLHQDFAANLAEARMRSCGENLHILAAAVAMVNQEAKEPMPALDTGKLLTAKALRSIPRCPDQGTYGFAGAPGQNHEVTCSIHGSVTRLRPGVGDVARIEPFDPDLWAVSRVQALGTTSEVHTRVRVSDAQARARLKATFAKRLEAARSPAPKQGVTAGDPTSFIPGLDQAKIVEQGEWLGVVAPQVDLEQVFPPEKPSPDTKRGKEPKKNDCPTNLRVIMGAVEMYNMDHEQFMKTLELALLTEQTYLKEKPVCPENGTYTLEEAGTETRVKCTIHGVAP